MFFNKLTSTTQKPMVVYERTVQIHNKFMILVCSNK